MKLFFRQVVLQNCNVLVMLLGMILARTFLRETNLYVMLNCCNGDDEMDDDHTL